jgi:hypothetical protein
MKPSRGKERQAMVIKIQIEIKRSRATAKRKAPTPQKRAGELIKNKIIILQKG